MSTLKSDELIASIAGVCSNGPPVEETMSFPPMIRIDARDLVSVAHHLQQHPDMWFDMLSCITGLDNGPGPGTMEVIYTLSSIPHASQLNLKVVVSRNEPVVASVSSIWRTADWHEREVFDLYGIHFTDHPDLRRILLPADWEGHPLRKDYVHQARYRDIEVKY